MEYDTKFSTFLSGLGAIDGIIGGEPIRSFDLIKDQNEIGVHPCNDLTDYALGRWFRRKLNIGNAEIIGKKLTEIQLAANPDRYDYFSGVSATVWYDNIRITNNGKVKLVIFESANNIDLSAATLAGQRLANAEVSIVNVKDAK